MKVKTRRQAAAIPRKDEAAKLGTACKANRSVADGLIYVAFRCKLGN